MLGIEPTMGPRESRRKEVPMNAGKNLLFVLAVPIVLIAALPTSSAAQLTCGWCHDFWFVWHSFPNGGDRCPSPKPRDGECSRCGGTSDCHEKRRWGRCHMPCGGGGPTTAALEEAISEVETGLEAAIPAVVAAAVARERGELLVEYVPRAGRIDFLLPCDPSVPIHTVPVSPDFRQPLEAGIAAVAALVPRHNVSGRAAQQ